MLFGCKNNNEFDEIVILKGNSFSYPDQKCFVINLLDGSSFSSYLVNQGDNGIVEKKYELKSNKTIINKMIINKIIDNINQINIYKIKNQNVVLSDGYNLQFYFLENNVIKKKLVSDRDEIPKQIYNIYNIITELNVEFEFDTSLLSRIGLNKARTFGFCDSTALNKSKNIELSRLQDNPGCNDAQTNLLMNALLKGSVTYESKNNDLFLIWVNMDSERQYPPIFFSAQTDGRYYSFPVANGDTLTVDIGYNFLETTLEEEYQKWQRESKK